MTLLIDPSLQGPIGYQREFLEAYEPGSTWYLPEATRAQLHEMGRTPVGERPAGTYARDMQKSGLMHSPFRICTPYSHRISCLTTPPVADYAEALSKFLEQSFTPWPRLKSLPTQGRQRCRMGGVIGTGKTPLPRETV